MKNVLAVLILTGIILAVTGCSKDEPGVGTPSEGATPGSTTAPEELLSEGKACEITAFSIGKADSILISSGAYNILIDTGETYNAGYIIEKLKEKKIEKLDLVIITHFDKDHVGGVPQILDEIAFDKVIYPDYSNTKPGYFAFRMLIEDYNLNGTIDKESLFEFGDLKLSIYPEKDPEMLRLTTDSMDNDMSLVCILEFAGKRFMFAGDIERERMKELLDDASEKGGIDLKCDWIKMPHHGRYNKILKDFLEKCDPEYAVLTDSEKEPADKKTTELLKKNKIQTYTTRDGDVVTYVDEYGISVFIR